jgi:CubicO group peptidase (beta-lactamase class C family)
MRRLLSLLITVSFCCAEAAEKPDDLAPLLRSHLEKTRFPAFAAVVVRGTNIVAAGATGVRKAGSSEKVTIEDKFHIGSCTKSITALLAVFMDREGTIRLTNRVGETLRDWKIPERAAEISLQQLLQNRSGLAGKPDEKLWRRAFLDLGEGPAQRRRFLEGFLGAPLAAEAGTKYVYSNQGFSLAGAMLETAAKKSWEDLVRERIFKKLSLKSAGFGPPSISDEVDQPWGHVWENGKATAKEPSDNPRAIAPAGAVHMSILDCARYAAFHLAVARGEIAELLDYRDKLYEPPTGGNYALGWTVDKRPWAKGKVITHAGSNTMFYTVIWIAPERNFACVVSTNIADRENEVAKACDEIVGDLIKNYVLHADSKAE